MKSNHQKHMSEFDHDDAQNDEEELALNEDGEVEADDSEEKAPEDMDGFHTTEEEEEGF
jgi:hypothetical protein